VDCIDARAALSALYDGEPVDAACLTALEHRATCAECDAFARALEAVAAIPSPSAPPDLAERVSAAVSAEAAMVGQRKAAMEVAAPPDSDLAVRAFAGRADAAVPMWLTRQRLWMGTAGLTLVAAMIAAVFVISGQGAGPDAGETDVATAVREALQKDVSSAGVGSAATAPPTTAAPAGPATAPDYVAFETLVYVAGSPVKAGASVLTTIGATQTALQGYSAQSVTVLRAADSKGDIVLALPGGVYQSFSPVRRQLAGRDYRLVAGTGVDRFGVWPSLPSDWVTPASADGSPYYRAAGTDALGVRVFVRIGQTPALGFMVPPGTPATDPAAGNPNWTLWLPQP
jgi:negative regulator of sigma E activity